MISLAISGFVSLILALLFTFMIIKWMQKRSLGQIVRQEGPKAHEAKSGTPTLGGVAIVLAAILGFGASHLIVLEDIRTRAAFLVLIILFLSGVIGFIDDYLKLKRKHNLGLNKRAKIAAQLAVAIIFVVLAENWAHVYENLTFTRYNFPAGAHLGPILWGIFAVLVIVGCQNAVNLTDGLDGLAAGSSAVVFASLTFFGFFIFRHEGLYKLVPALDLSSVSIALMAACVGFLWWNANPAKIIMGDTGALAIGGGMAAIFLQMNMALLLPIIGGLFVVETLSVLIQVASFKMTKKRPFRMAPIHHHFELKGWAESTVIVRFWIISAIFSGIGVAIFYADFIAVNSRSILL